MSINCSTAIAVATPASRLTDQSPVSAGLPTVGDDDVGADAVLEPVEDGAAQLRAWFSGRGRSVWGLAQVLSRPSADHPAPWTGGAPNARRCLSPAMYRTDSYTETLARRGARRRWVRQSLFDLDGENLTRDQVEELQRKAAAGEPMSLWELFAYDAARRVSPKKPRGSRVRP